MESIRESLAKYGNTWNTDVPPALAKLYGPIQAKLNGKYDGQIKAETAIKYGPDARNRLDVYSPVEADKSGGSGRPVAVFIHGGGLVAGDNNMYANIGELSSCHSTTARLIRV